jgi:hypothetical protein
VPAQVLEHAADGQQPGATRAVLAVMIEACRDAAALAPHAADIAAVLQA